MTDQVHPGELVRLTASFTDPDGAPADPTEVRLRVKADAQDEELVNVERDDTGEYHANYIIPFAGPAFRVLYRWEGSGAIQAVLEGEFEVRSRWPELP